MVANGFLEPLLAADLYLVNMFGNVECPRIRQVLRTHFPEASAWTEWQHQSDSVTSLSTGTTSASNRGAEQGDVVGTFQSALVLGDARVAHLRDFLSSSLEAQGVCDEWFVDDGQVFVRPWSFDKWLRAPPSHPLEPPEAARRLAMSRALPVFSVRLGACRSFFAGVCFRLSRAMRSAITGVDHARTEMVLGDLPDHSWWQATTGVSFDGLGLLTAIGAALPAFVASRIVCRPLVPEREHGV